MERLMNHFQDDSSVYNGNGKSRNYRYMYPTYQCRDMKWLYQNTDKFKRESRQETTFKSAFKTLSNIFNRIIMPHKAYCLTPRRDIKEMYEEYKDMIGPESIEEDENMTGWDRLKLMWMGSLYATSSEIEMVGNVFLGSIMVGFFWGATVGNVDDIRKFKKRHNEMVFEGEYLAKRKLIDTVMINQAKKGFLLAKTMFFFPTTFAALALSAVVYRNDINPLDFAASGAIAAALWKAWRGPKAQVAAAMTGGAFGLVMGCFSWALFKVSGTSYKEYRRWYSHRRWNTHNQLSGKSWKEYEEKVRNSKNELINAGIILLEHDDLNKFREEVQVADKLRKDLKDVPKSKGGPSDVISDKTKVSSESVSKIADRK